MSTYKESGVDIKLSDECSHAAYEFAKKTFSNRQGKIGEPVNVEDGFSGALDFGDFYIVQNADGVGTKAMIAAQMQKYDTLGYDLVAMVADDGVCLGAEMVALTNTIDMQKEDLKVVEQLMAGLEKACKEAGMAVSGGEIAVLGDEVKNFTWNAAAIGVLRKERLITGAKIKDGDQIIGVRSAGFRSNGFSLIRKILQDNYGEDYCHHPYSEHKTWGEMLLTPSIIYCRHIQELLGGFGGKPVAEIHGIVHVTGGGIPNNLMRLLHPNNLGAKLEQLLPPHEMMIRLQELGAVDDKEAYSVWNMGTGMILISAEAEKIIKFLEERGLETQIMGEVTGIPEIELVSQGYFSPEQTLSF